MPKNILTDDENYHGTQNIKSFLVFACADISFLKNGLQKPQIWPKMAISLFLAYFVGHFSYHSNG